MRKSIKRRKDINHLIRNVEGIEFCADVEDLFAGSGTAFAKETKLGQSSSSGTTSTSGGWSRSWSWGSGCRGSTGPDLDRVEAGGLRAFGSGAFTVGLLDGDADLALVEELGTVGIFVDVRLLTSRQIRGIFQIVEQEFVQSAALLVQNLHSVSVSVVNHAAVHDSAESVDRFGIASPFMVDLLADCGKLDGLSSWASFQNLQMNGNCCSFSKIVSMFTITVSTQDTDLVFADRHRHHLGLELGGDFGHLKLGRDGLVRLHVEALDPVGTIDLRDELGMEGDDHGGRDEHALGIQRSGAGNVAGIEGQFDAGHLAAMFIRTASGLVK